MGDGPEVGLEPTERTTDHVFFAQARMQYEARRPITRSELNSAPFPSADRTRIASYAHRLALRDGDGNHVERAIQLRFLAAALTTIAHPIARDPAKKDERATGIALIETNHRRFRRAAAPRLLSLPHSRLRAI